MDNSDKGTILLHRGPEGVTNRLTGASQCDIISIQSQNRHLAKKDSSMVSPVAYIGRPARRSVLVAVALALLGQLPLMPRAVAMTIADVPIPETYQIDGQALALNGAALRTIPVLRIKTYITALYLPRKMTDADAILNSPGPKVAVVHYLHSGTREQVQERYRAGEKNNCGQGECDTALEADFNRLVDAVVAVQPGDRTVFAVSNKGLSVSFNSQPFRAFGSTALGNLIIKGFIGPNAPTPEFRAALLGVP